MALLSTLLTALTRKIGDILQALFGWSVAALFGRLNSRTRLFVTIALVLALCWPVFVVGVFLPATATFVLAFVPIDNETVRQVLRIVWIVLAVVAPMLVGLLVRAAVPLKQRRSVGASITNGYPLALGMALSFLITLVTVPAVKIVSLVRRWKEEHVFVQPKEGRYEDVLRHLVAACEAAGLLPMVEMVPRRLALSTRVLKVLGRGSVDLLMTPNPRRVVCDGLELWLYPADLLLRGRPEMVSAVRARLTSTMIERDAWLVQEKRAQELQDELGRLWDVQQQHAVPEEAADGLMKRLTSIVRESYDAHSVPFDDWMVLDRMARRLEGALQQRDSLIDALAGEPVFDERKKAARVVAAKLPVSASVPELVHALVRESKELARLEAALARDEAKRELAASTRSAVGFGATISLVGAALGLLATALVIGLGASATTTVAIAGGIAALAVFAAVFAWNSIPRKPMERTRKRLATELKLIEERAA